MVMSTQKRVATSIGAIVLLISSTFSQSTNDNLLGKIATGALIVGGIIGVGAAIGYALSKSDEQITDEGFDAVRTAEIERSRFYDIYRDAYYYLSSGLEGIEQQLLYPIALRAWEKNISVDTYIGKIQDHKITLQNMRSTISDRIRNLENNSETYRPVYHRLQDARRAITEELNFIDAYYAQLAPHRAFFELYAYEARLYQKYHRELEIGRSYAHDPYLFERYILQAIGSHDARSTYPLVTYDAQLTDHINTLARYINNLKYYYPGRTVLANQLIEYLRSMRGVLEASPAFREEKRLKREAEERQAWLEHQTWLELQRQKAEREAYARETDAILERERLRSREERRHHEQPTVIIMNNC